MAGVKFEFEFNTNEFLAFRKIIDIFPELRAQMLGFVGSRGKDILYNDYLSGQELRYDGRKDKKGRDKVSYGISRRASAVKIRSYPANLFEKGRGLRGGSRETGKFIITRKFNKTMAGKLTNILNEFDRMYLQRKLDKI